MTSVSLPGSGVTQGRLLHRLAIPLAILPFLTSAALEFNDGPDPEAGDYAHYLLHARALAEGRPYADTGYIFTDEAWVIGPASQPPGLPTLLAPVLAVSNENMVVVRLVMLLLSVGFVVSVGRYFSAREGTVWGAGVALLVGLAFPIVDISSQVLSDVPFAALIWWLLFVYDRDHQWGFRKIFAATVVGGAALAFRTAGLAIAPAIVLFTVVNYPRLGWRPLSPLLLWGIAAGMAALAFGLPPGLAGRDFLALSEIPSTALANLLQYRFAVAESLLYPFPGDLANDAYHFIALLIVALGLGEWLKRAWRSLAVAFSAAYASMLLIVPVFDGRYFFPLFPIIVFGLLNGSYVLAGLVRTGWSASLRRRVVLGCASAIALGSIVFRPSEETQESLADEPSVQGVFDHLRDAGASADLRVAFVKPRVLTWETGIPAMGTFSAPPNRTVGILGREEITHVVLGDFGLAPGSDRAFRRAVEGAPEQFVLEYSNDEFEVYGTVEASQGPEGRSR